MVLHRGLTSRVCSKAGCNSILQADCRFCRICGTSSIVCEEDAPLPRPRTVLNGGSLCDPNPAGPSLCLVFRSYMGARRERELLQREMAEIEEQDGAQSMADAARKTSTNLEGSSSEDFVKRLLAVGLLCQACCSDDDKYLFLIVSLPEPIAEQCADLHEQELELAKYRAVEYSRKSKPPLPLAEHTLVKDDPPHDEDTLSLSLWEGLHMRYNSFYKDLFMRYPMVAVNLPEEDLFGAQEPEWISFAEDNTELDGFVMKVDKSQADNVTLFTPATRLRLLYELCTDDLETAGGHGAGLKLEDWKVAPFCYFLFRTFENCCPCLATDLRRERNSHLDLSEIEAESAPRSAFELYFPMQHPDDEGWTKLKQMFYLQQDMKHFWATVLPIPCDIGCWKQGKLYDRKVPGQLRFYFGEYVAIYFAFLQHLFQASIAFAVLVSPATIYFLFHKIIVSDEKERQHIQYLLFMGQSVLMVIWGQVQMEVWKRTENRYRCEWGMCNISSTSCARPEFEGVYVRSRVTGRKEEQHKSHAMFTSRVIFFHLMNLIVVFIFAIMFLGLEFLSRNPAIVGDIPTFLSGLIFMLTLEIVTATYEEIDGNLTNCENHRLETEFENSFIVKRWCFYFVTHCGMIIYMLFFKGYLTPCIYGAEYTFAEECLGFRWDIPHNFNSTLSIAENAAIGNCCITPEGPYDMEFEKLQNAEIIRIASGFLSGWLIGKIFAQNIFEWFSPRFFGFICARGLYPCIICDFIVDLATQCKNPETTRSRLRRSLFGLCRKRRSLDARTSEAQKLSESAENKRYEHNFSDTDRRVQKEVVKFAEINLDRMVYWKVLDNTNELTQLYMMMMLCAVIFPLSPILFTINSVIEFHFDIFRLFDRRQPVPIATGGLAKAWQCVFQLYNHIACFSNIAIIVFRTTLMEDLGIKNDTAHKLVAVFVVTFLTIALVHIVDLLIPDTPINWQEHRLRQDEVAQHIARVTVKPAAKVQLREAKAIASRSQSNLGMLLGDATYTTLGSSSEQIQNGAGGPRGAPPQKAGCSSSSSGGGLAEQPLGLEEDDVAKAMPESLMIPDEKKMQSELRARGDQHASATPESLERLPPLERVGEQSRDCYGSAVAPTATSRTRGDPATLVTL